MNETVLAAEGVHKRFVLRQNAVERLRRRAARVVVAVDDVSLTVERGRILGIVGESGCGKSTLARCILRLEELDGGRVQLDGRDLATLSPRELRGERRRLQTAFQDPYLAQSRLTVGDAIAELLRCTVSRLAAKPRRM